MPEIALQFASQPRLREDRQHGPRHDSRSQPQSAELPQLLPTSRWTPDEALKHFLASREKTIEYMKTEPGLRTHVADSPLGQPLDAYEWLLFIGAHSKRHTEQIDEVKAYPNFPKS